MNHSVETIRDYVCDYYGIPVSLLISSSRKYELVRARQMILLLAGLGRDRLVAEVTGRNRSTQCSTRKTIWANMEVDKNLQMEYKILKDGLMKYELNLTA